MKKSAMLVIVVATTTAVASAIAASVPYEKNRRVNDNWGNGTTEYVWKNGTDELCWRDSQWTPATANAQCDGALMATRAEPKIVEPKKSDLINESTLFTLSADALFDFDKAVIKPAGKKALTDIVPAIKNAAVDQVTVNGYTDSFGSERYNDRLSLRRAEAVKAYLVSQGLPSDRIVTNGKGKHDFKVDPKSCKGTHKTQIACQQPNRRVEIQLVGTNR